MEVRTMTSYLYRKAAVRAVRPIVDGLESRALLSSVATAHAAVAALKVKHLSTIAEIAKTKPQKVSTVPSDGDVNPYGVAFVPSGFPSGGKLGLTPGEVLVSNFNNSKNLQGTGTTIVGVSSGNQAALVFQGPPQGSPGVTGLSTALGVLQAGYVVVGDVPSTDGTSATAKQGGLLFIDKNGNVAANLTDPNLLDGPWDLAINDQGTSAQIFVANVLNGTVTRVNVTFSSSGAINTSMTQMTQIASGYMFRGDPAAFEIGPTGLAFNATTHTLYVASTAGNKVFAIANADTVGTQTGMGSVVYTDKAHLHGPLGLTLAPDGNLIAAQGDAINPSKRQTSELVEFTPKGKFVGQFSLSKMAGGAFGVASSPDGTKFAAVNDITNALEIWPV
jgi:hypothetical protein